jgi:hypothetical protein
MNTPSWSLTVGRIRPISINRLANRWLVSGRTRSLNQVSRADRAAAASSGPTRMRARLTPLALSAVISLSWESRPKVMRAATSTAQGAERATI